MLPALQNFLDRLKPPAPRAGSAQESARSDAGKAVVVRRTSEVGAPLESRGPVPHQRQLTPAAIVYTLGAGVLFVMAFYNLSHGAWFNGIVIFVPAGSLLALAYKYLQ